MENKEKMHKHGWKRGFVRMTSMLMLCFNMISAPLTIICTATIAVATITLVVSCDKEQPEPTPQKHNVELIMTVSNQYQNIAMDTIYKYNDDPTVDSIFMVPQSATMWNADNTNILKNRVTYLRARHNVNPNKVFGKGELQLKAESVQNNPEITRFFADTLKYNVTFWNDTKQR